VPQKRLSKKIFSNWPLEALEWIMAEIFFLIPHLGIQDEPLANSEIDGTFPIQK
jgi:hypothetical protein